MGVAMGRHVGVAMGRHVGAAMGRHTDLVLDASLPKHKKISEIRPVCKLKLVSYQKYDIARKIQILCKTVKYILIL